MSVSRLASMAAIAVMLAAAPVLLSASDSPTKKADNKSVSESQSVSAPASSLATLKAVKAAPMTSKELETVKGTHVHFLDGAGGFHLAGNPEGGQGTGNWYDNGNSSDSLVAPSYHGLCVAQGVGVGGISIPGAAVQC